MADGMRITCRWCSHERISRVIPAKSIVKLTIHTMTEYLLLINIRDVDIDISTTVLLLHLLNQSIHLPSHLNALVFIPILVREFLGDGRGILRNVADSNFCATFGKPWRLQNQFLVRLQTNTSLPMRSRGMGMLISAVVSAVVETPKKPAKSPEGLGIKKWWMSLS